MVPTKLEQAQERQIVWTGVGLATSAGVPLDFALREEGFTDEEIKMLGADRIAQIQRDQMLASEDVVPAQGQ